MVFDPRSENTHVIVGADLLLTVIGNTLSQEGGDVVRLYRKDCGPDDLVIKRGKGVAQLFEHDVCCTLNLLDRPCVAQAACFRNRTIAFAKAARTLWRYSGLILSESFWAASTSEISRKALSCMR